MTNPAYDVIISGAGPTGLLLAIDLGQRGVKTLLAEKNSEPGPWPKMERTNPRSMEILRRLGIDDQVRAVGYPAEASMDIVIGTSLGEPALVNLRFPTVQEYRTKILDPQSNALPLEPYQLVSQYDLEPVLKKVAEGTPNVTVAFGLETLQFEDSGSEVTVNFKTVSGEEQTHTAQFLVACDGGASQIRKALDIPLSGQGRIRTLTQVQFRSEQLYEAIRAGKGRHYLLLNGHTVVVQGNRTDFTLHTELPEDSDFETIIQDAIGMDIPFEILRLNRWNHNLLVADQFRKKRVFLAGDAAHLLIPNGGLGMNTAVGDAMTLSWQLAALTQGWGGPDLLDAYEQERRPVALFNVEASRWATDQLGAWKKHVTPVTLERSAAGEQARKDLKELATHHTTLSYSMTGAELGYIYNESSIIVHDQRTTPHWEILRYQPSGVPGERLAHSWLNDGTAMQDRLGQGFTLLSLAAEPIPETLKQQFHDAGVPLACVEVAEPQLAQRYGAAIILVRPDAHIAWRGDSLEQDISDVLLKVTGFAQTQQHTDPAMSMARS